MQIKEKQNFDNAGHVQTVKLNSKSTKFTSNRIGMKTQKLMDGFVPLGRGVIPIC